MQVFNTFFKIAYKRLGSIVMYLIIFSTLVFLLAGNTDTSSTSFEASEMNICVIDEDNTDASKALTAFLDKNHNLVVLENDKEVLQDSLYYNAVDYILTIPDGFQKKLIKGDTDDLLTNVKVPGTTSGSFADQQIYEYVDTIKLYIEGGFSVEDAITNTNSSYDNLEDVNSISFVEKSDNSDISFYYYFQYVPYILILLLLNGLAPIIITFNEKEINNRITCSSLTLTNKNAQIILSVIVYSILTWIIFMILAFIRFGSMLFTNSGVLCMLNSFVFMTISSALTLFISSFSPDSGALSLISNITGLGLSFLGGIFVPVWLLSDKVLAFSKFLPTYWYVKGNNMLGQLSGESYDLKQFLTYVAIELIFTVTLVILSIVASKTVREKRIS